MLFNTFEFFVFFFIVYSLYGLLPFRWQNRMLLVASYVFYGQWDAMFLTLIFVSTILDYICGLEIAASRSERRRRFFLALSIAGNLAILGYFKYAGFFVENLQHLLQKIGVPFSVETLDVILPVGISFYTFQTMSYSWDVYRGLIKPTRNIFDFALYVAFFPQLVAGPIERAAHLLPQILNPRRVTKTDFQVGWWMIFWGLFLKVFVADNLARIADPVFASAGPYDASAVVMAVYAFTLQIYCDFAGYSWIAIGLGRCMGFRLMTNFHLPYFTTNPRELWQRWHISFSSWLRDYVFKPLGGYSRGRARALRNILITFFLGGLWHGANWTFVVWGIYHAVLLMGYVLLRPVLTRVGEPCRPFWRSVWWGARVVLFFHLFCAGALIFRAQSCAQAMTMFAALPQGVSLAGLKANGWDDFLFFAAPLLVMQCLQYRSQDLLVMFRWPWPLRTGLYVFMFYGLVLFGVQGGEQFYYFQF